MTMSDKVMAAWRMLEHERPIGCAHLLAGVPLAKYTCLLHPQAGVMCGPHPDAPIGGVAPCIVGHCLRHARRCAECDGVLDDDAPDDFAATPATPFPVKLLTLISPADRRPLTQDNAEVYLIGAATCAACTPASVAGLG